MDFNALALVAMQETNDVILLTDLDTHALLYINEAGLCQFQIPPELDYTTQPCYRALRGFDDLCDGCPLPHLTHGEFYHWDYYNPKVNRQFSARGKLLELEGRTVHLEIACDVTDLHNTNLALAQRLHHEETLLCCIRVLAFASDLNGALLKLLSLVGDYYGADRVYIFELDASGNTLTQTYAWSAPGMALQSTPLPRIPVSDLSYWIDCFQRDGEVVLSDLASIPPESSAIRKRIEGRGVEALICSPLLLDGQIIGFCAVDDPKEIQLGAELLRAVAVFMAADLGKWRLNNQVTRLTYGDDVTNTGSRWAFLEALRQLQEQPPQQLGMLFLDINGLNRVNGSKGHAYGDYLLRHAGDTLCTLFDEGVYRMGGDEFVVLCPNISQLAFEQTHALLLERIRQDPDLPVSTGAIWRAGSQVDPGHMASLSEQLLQQEKQCYYAARSLGSGDYRDTLSKNLLQDLAQGAFCVYLQPKVNVKTGALIGAEALIRRIDAQGALIPPIRFIPLYETEGIIRHLDFFVLDSVCTALAQWRDAGLSLPIISVNCSRVTAAEPDIAQQLLGVCLRRNIDPHMIMIEITERIGTLTRDNLDKLLSSLSGAGFLLSLDDFGAEYSNLELLSFVGFDEVKLDKSLVDHLQTSRSSRIVVSHVIAMCHELGNSTILAEGIETNAQRDILLDFNCEGGQGYLFAKPMPLSEFYEKYIFTSAET